MDDDTYRSVLEAHGIRPGDIEGPARDLTIPSTEQTRWVQQASSVDMAIAEAFGIPNMLHKQVLEANGTRDAEATHTATVPRELPQPVNSLEGAIAQAFGAAINTVSPLPSGPAQRRDSLFPMQWSHVAEDELQQEPEEEPATGGSDLFEGSGSDDSTTPPRHEPLQRAVHSVDVTLSTLCALDNHMDSHGLHSLEVSTLLKKLSVSSPTPVAAAVLRAFATTLHRASSAPAGEDIFAPPATLGIPVRRQPSPDSASAGNPRLQDRAGRSPSPPDGGRARGRSSFSYSRARRSSSRDECCYEVVAGSPIPGSSHSTSPIGRHLIGELVGEAEDGGRVLRPTGEASHGLLGQRMRGASFRSARLSPPALFRTSAASPQTRGRPPCRAVPASGPRVLFEGGCEGGTNGICDGRHTAGGQPPRVPAVPLRARREDLQVLKEQLDASGSSRVTIAELLEATLAMGAVNGVADGSQHRPVNRAEATVLCVFLGPRPWIDRLCEAERNDPLANPLAA